MENVVQDFAKNFRFLRIQKGYSQTKLAELLGVTKQTIINYEKGETFPPASRVLEIVKVLDTTSEQLFGVENLFANTNTELVDMYAEKAVVTAQIHYFSELVGDSEENQKKFRTFLLKMLNLEDKSNEELIQMITGYYDSKIKIKNEDLEKNAHQLAYNGIQLDIQLGSPELYGKFQMIDKLAIMKET